MYLDFYGKIVNTIEHFNQLFIFNLAYDINKLKHMINYHTIRLLKKKK